MPKTETHTGNTAAINDTMHSCSYYCQNEKCIKAQRDELVKKHVEMESKMINKFELGDLVRKRKGSEWEGFVVGTYSTELTPEGYAVESRDHAGSVQIYPAAALEPVPQGESK